MQNNYVMNVKKSYIYGLLISLVLFCLISILIFMFEPAVSSIEGKINHSLQSVYNVTYTDFSGGFFNSIMAFFTWIGDPTTVSVITVGIAIILFIRKYTLLSLWTLAVVSTGGLAGVVFKNFIERSRPDGHLAVDSGFSFPSGHATASSLLILIVLLVFIPKIKHIYLRYSVITVTVLVWLAVLYSRLYFNAHYLTDLTAGVVFSIFYVLTAMYIYVLTSAWFKQNMFKKGEI